MEQWIGTYFDRLLTLVVLVVTAVRWYWDRQLAKTLDTSAVRRKVEGLQTDVEILREDVDTLDARVHRFTSERLPTLLKELKAECEVYVNRELSHLRELFKVPR